MSAAAHAAEADRVELVYYWALNQLTNKAAADALALWNENPPTGSAASRRTWLSASKRLIANHRSLASTLALSYYRLVRALRTGSTITLPGDPPPRTGATIGLNNLRDRFEAAVDTVESVALPATPPPPQDTPIPEPRQETPEPELDEGDDDDAILLEQIRELEEEAARLDDEAERELELLLKELGEKALDKKLADIEDNLDDETLAADADAARKEAQDEAGKRQAATASRITMNAARGLTYTLAGFDRRVIGWARYSQTGTPCGWCAMLISRGAVYKSRGSASAGSRAKRGRYDGNSSPIEDVDKYHDNCRCVAIPIFSREQYSSPLFNLNRQYADEWPRVTKGYSGSAALAVWRRYIRQQQKAAQAVA